MVKIQTTLTSGRPQEQTKDNIVKVPVFIFSDSYEVKELSRLIIEVKPTYLINCSNSVESLKNHVKRTVVNNIVFLIDIEALTEIKKDYALMKKIKLIDLFNNKWF